MIASSAISTTTVGGHETDKNRSHQDADDQAKSVDEEDGKFRIGESLHAERAHVDCTSYIRFRS